MHMKAHKEFAPRRTPASWRGLCCRLAPILLLAGTVWADPSNPPPREAERAGAAEAVQPPFAHPSYSGSVWRSIAALALVLGGLAAARFYLMRRGLAGIRPGRNRRLRIVDRLPIDQRKSILLVALDGREFLVAAGADRITLLAEADNPFAELPEGEEESVSRHE